MMNFFCIDQLPHSAWKNGGGMTREIMSWPLGADFASFDWRVSVATISASGPFSRFEGIDRVIMLLEGDGVRLVGADTDWRLDQPGKPFAFSGDEQLGGELLGAESTDFNVMTRRSVATAGVQIIDSSRTVTAKDGGLVMCLSGSWSLGLQPIEKWQGCWWTDSAEPLHVEKESASHADLVFVSWTRLATTT